MRHGSIIRSFSDKPLAELYAQMLQDAGVPVRLEIPLTGAAIFSPGMADMYIENDELLQDPEIRKTIQAVLEPTEDDLAANDLTED